jgi:CelD/BcsL family acetyltransferase involved in cellulose biosynthesis
VNGSSGSGAVTFSLERPDKAELERLWTELEARADITLYLSWSWIGIWIEQAGIPEFVVVGRAGGEIVCLGLFRRSVQRRHGFVRSRTLCLHETGDEDKDVIFIEYNGFLTDRRFVPIEPAALAYLHQHGVSAGGYDEIQLGGVAEDRYEAVRAAGFKTYVHALKTTAFVDLDAIRSAGGDYLATLSSNSRYQIRRALKIYESRGELALERARSVEEALLFFDALGELHERAWQDRSVGGAWRFPFLVSFHRRLIETRFADGGIELVRISCAGEPVGYIHCLVHDGWIGSYLSGFAYEADNKVKPGLVSFYLYIQHLLKSDGQVFDFLAGDHRYKLSLGQPGPNMYWYRVQEDRWALRLEDGLRWVKHRLEKLRKRDATSLPA